MTRFRWFAVPLVFLVIGCGGDDAIPKAEFLEKANAVCDVEFEDIDAAVDAMSDKPSQQEIEDVTVDSILPSVQKQVDGIREIGLPEGDEEEVETLLDDAQAAIDELNDDPTLVGSEEDPFIDVYPRLQRYGLDDCVS